MFVEQLYYMVARMRVISAAVVALPRTERSCVDGAKSMTPRLYLLGLRALEESCARAGTKNEG